MSITTEMDKIYKRRREMGISQSELGKRANVSRNYISAIERGRVDNVSLFVLAKICAALRMEIKITVTSYEDILRGKI